MIRFSKHGAFVITSMALFSLLIISYFNVVCSVQKRGEDEGYTLRGGKLVDGKFGRGFLAEKKGDKFILPTKGSLSRERGTIEMWVKHVLPQEKRPEWAPLFTMLLEPYPKELMDFKGLVVQFMEHSQQILFILGRFGDPSHGLVTPNLHWKAGEYHHVAVSWGEKGMHIYIDGREAAGNDYTGALPGLHEKMCVGCYFLDSIKEPAAAVIDDLRISDVQRSEKEIAQTFRANEPVKMDEHTRLIAHFEDPMVSYPSRRYGDTVTREEEREGVKHASPRSRTFYMGMTPFEYDTTPEAKDQTYKFIEEHTDLIAHHFDEGIPWPEAFDKSSYPPDVEGNLKSRAQHTRRKQKVYLAITPLNIGRDGLADYWAKDAHTKRPGKWKNKDLDDPEVIAAYLNFSRDLIQRFRPDFMTYAVEVNMLAKNKTKWSKFVKLAREVYTKLKAENPRLPLFMSLQIENFLGDEKNQRRALSEILPYTDYIAVSTYPYLAFSKLSQLPKDHFSKMAALAPDKPFTVAETGYIAKDLNALGFKVKGQEESQDEYLRFLLEESNRLHARFIVWFVPRDYDLLWDKIKSFGKSVEIFKIWKDTGLVDGRGNKRKSFETWGQWLKLPRR